MSDELSYTQQVKNLIRDFHDPDGAEDSSISVAKAYFQESANVNSGDFKLLTKEDDEKRQIRLGNIIYVAQQIIRLSEGKNKQETLKLSSRFLATFLLLSPYEGEEACKLHQRMKHIYKAVLSVRLLDSLLEKGLIKNEYILKYANSSERFSTSKDGLSDYQRCIVQPLIIANLIQDVGLFHQISQEILVGSLGNKDEFRVLEKDERVLLLRVTYKATLDYLLTGLGRQKYQGDSIKERGEFNQQQTEQMVFMEEMLRGALSPKDGIGNLIKIPQVYTSVIMSTKPKMDYADLPKAIVFIEKLAKEGNLYEAFTKCFMQIVGVFPMGFGIVGLPGDQEPIESYECAVVNGLRAKKKREPNCLYLTQDLQFEDDLPLKTITEANNLYFPNARETLSTVSEKHLEEIKVIFQGTTHNTVNNSLLPKYWNPHKVFMTGILPSFEF